MTPQHATGFTLIELMIVIAIIGILAAIALPAYQTHTARAQVAEAITLASGLKAAVSEAYHTHAQCPMNRQNAHLGIAQYQHISGNYVEHIEVQNGTNGAQCQLFITFKNKDISKDLQSKTMVLAMHTAQGANTWTCQSDSIDVKYLPVECRP